MIIYFPMIILHVPFIAPRAIALWPFVLLRHKHEHADKVLINHEKIHLRQQLELLIIPFYLIYIAEYLYHLVKYKNHDEAYMNISFEREAYAHEDELQYLSQRPLWASFRN